MLMDILEKLKNYGELRVTGNRIKVCIPSKCRQDRIEVLHQINENFQDFCCCLMHDKPSYSSIGYVKIQDYKISVKSQKQQSDMSPGMSNEQVLVQQIDKYIKGHQNINLIFFSGNFQVVYCDVVECTATKNKKLRKGRNKADMIIKTPQSNYCVSVKQHDAERWESADTSHGSIALDKLNDALALQKTKLVAVKDDQGNCLVRSDGRGVMKLQTELFWQMNDQEKSQTIFGDDICEKGAVVFNTFKPNHFVFDSETKTLRVECDRIYTKHTQVDDQDTPCWIIRNDITRNCLKLGIPGLRIESVFKSRIKYGVEI
jgi:hypothetical protein